MNPQAKELWAKIRNANCTRCELHEEAQTVCLVGDGPVPAEYMILGEAPGFREDDVRKPFAGKSGVLLDKSLAKVGLARRDAFISNVVKCRPPENRTPGKVEMDACRPYLDKEMKAVKPKFILTVGNSALKGMTKKSGIMKQRGTWFEVDGAMLMPTIHPAAVLRNPHWEKLFVTDLAAFARAVKGEESAVPSPRTFLITTKKGISALIRAILASEAVAYDLETSRFAEWKDDSLVATIAVATQPGVAFVVPIHHASNPWKRPERVLEAIGSALAYTSAKVIAHNGKFDDKWMIRHTGKPVYSDFDCMLAAHLLDENRLKGLKPLASMLLGVDQWADVDLNKGKALTEPIKKLARYNAKDADYTLRLYYRFKKELKQRGNERALRLYTKLTMPASRALTDIELAGMWVDRKRLLKRLAKVRKQVKKYDKALMKIVGYEVNWNSPQQVAKVLFDELELPIVELTAKGAASTKESVLLRLREHHPIIKLILKRREWAKKDSSFLGNYIQALDKDDRIHTSFKVAGTVTGRLSSGKEEGDKSKGLNVQQVPRDNLIRGVFGAPPGWMFVEADLSQIEMRIAAHYSQDPTLMGIFHRNEDVHMNMAVKLTGKLPDQIDKETRKKAKAVNFGYLFGMGWRKFIEYAFEKYDLIVSEDEARASQDEYFTSFRKLRPWHDRQRRLVNNYKQVTSLIGRTRHLPDIDSEDEEVRREAERQAINSPVQGLASDLNLLAIIILHEMMDPKEAFIVSTVHDSTLFQIREDVVDKWVPIIKQTMEHLPLKQKFGVTLDVPIRVDVSVGKYWGEGEPVSA